MSGADEESALCTSCGLCCTGDLYADGLLDEDEVEPARRLGMLVESITGERPRFLQPCPAYRGNCCTIYRDRPRVCRTYRCRLLKRLQAGQVPLDEAQAVTAEGVRLASVARAQLPSGGGLSAGRSLLKQPETPSLTKLHLLSFARYMDLHFRRKSDHPWIEQQPLATAPGEKM